MHHNNIKCVVQKQLETQFPNWKRLGRKTKRKLAKQVLAEVNAEYNLSVPIADHLGKGNSEAIELWESNHPMLGDQFSPEVLELISRALQNFNFAPALEYLTASVDREAKIYTEDNL